MSRRYHVEVTPQVSALIGIHSRDRPDGWAGEANAALTRAVVTLAAGGDDIWERELTDPHGVEVTVEQGLGCGQFELIEHPIRVFFWEVQEDVIRVYGVQPMDF